MKILVLAGGYDQIALIQKIKKRGHYVILADYYKNPPAKDVADMHYQISTLDEDAVCRVAEDEQVDMIVTACTDQALMTVASVSDRLGLPTYLSKMTALNVTNKSNMKKLLNDCNVPTAFSYVFKRTEEINYNLFEGAYPLVIKPCDCNSSKGVVKVQSFEKLKKAVQDAFELSRSHQVIVEEFMEGIELSIDIWNGNDEIKILSVTETIKRKDSENDFTICGSVYPAGINQDDEKQIYDIAERIINGFELPKGPVLIQAIKTKNGIKVIEFSTRMGGGTKYELIELISGVDIMEVYTQLVLDNMVKSVEPKKTTKSIEMIYIYARDGVFYKLLGFEDCKKEKIIDDYFLYKKPGTEIKSAKTSSDRISGVIISATNQEELLKKKQEFLHRADIWDINKESMMIKESIGE